MKNLFVKLLKVQQKMEVIMKTETNPFFKSRYADINTVLSALKPILNEVGIVLLQPILENKLVTIIADADSDEQLNWVADLPVASDPQKFGAAITYFRRYALVSLFCLEQEDDDGNKASSKSDTDQPFHNEPVIDRTMKACAKCNHPHNGPYTTCFSCYKQGLAKK